MEGAESKSPTLQEDSQINSEISITPADTIEGFQECMEDILDEIKQDESFSEMTAETYDIKKSYLRKQLTELSRLHRLLAGHHVNMMEEVSKNCPSLIKFHHLDVLTMAHDDLPEKNPDVLTENPKLKHELQENRSDIETDTEKVIELQKQVADLKLEISGSDLRIKTMEEELETSTKKLSIAKTVISNLKGEQSSKLFKENQLFKNELEAGRKLLNVAHKELAGQMEKYEILKEKVNAYVAEAKEHDDQVAKLNAKNERCKSEISKLEETLKSKEATWSQDVVRLKGQLKNKSKSYDELKKRLENVSSERYKITGQLENLQAEKCTQDKLIQELETSLNKLQAEHDGLVSAFENAEKLNNELKLKVVELETEVDRLEEAISVITEEKIEAIRQLSSSLEHYMSKYKQLHQSYVAYKTRCFGISSCLDTH